MKEMEAANFSGMSDSQDCVSEVVSARISNPSQTGLCSNCDTENPPSKKFCGDCGAALAPSRPTADCFERVAEAVRTREPTQVAPPRKTGPRTILIRKWGGIRRPSLACIA